ncbi:transmembrane protein 17B isoform X2 [Octopus bimaculoides]|uniref:Transmembrane protein 17B n=2 Tax=Octopus bimaculoides TaxID=37653 RepID=A0A0L8FNJ9_OCTBM|nr:transmembrane protein 17B isoform X2 [Octopus bimaculoides]|eukprot:XP_014788276.1 PREDICTED: transmembrane protein 17B-like isoform X2 [Octopus bimaculoides]
MASNVEATLRKTVSTMTDFLFPVSREDIKKNQHNILRSGHEYVTSLPFQMELYFNVWFFPFWLVSVIAALTFKVPELSGSWLLTLLMQFPLIIFLLFNESQTFPLEIALHIVMFGFILIEIFSGYFAIRTMINYQMTQFHLRQFSDLEFITQD